MGNKNTGPGGPRPTRRVRATRNVAGLPEEGTVFEVEDGRLVSGLLEHGSLVETTEPLTQGDSVVSTGGGSSGAADTSSGTDSGGGGE